jgi:formylglycine-generating enzyme required for sulfatase activity
MLRRILQFLLLAISCALMFLPGGRVQRLGLNGQLARVRATQRRDADLITIPAGTVQVGDNAGQFDELPAFNYTSRVFQMDCTPVTVAEFAAFAKDTGLGSDEEIDDASPPKKKKPRKTVLAEGSPAGTDLETLRQQLEAIRAKAPIPRACRLIPRRSVSTPCSMI